jgi:hypothetical protein
VVRHVDAVELRVVVAAVLAVAADPVLAAHHLPKLCAHLVTALARLHVYKLARRNGLEAGSTREKKGGEKRRNARVSRTGKSSGFTTLTFRAVQSALGMGGCGREIFVLATCPLQFAKAGSAAMLSQQDKINSADVQRDDFIRTVAS